MVGSQKPIQKVFVKTEFLQMASVMFQYFKTRIFKKRSSIFTPIGGLHVAFLKVKVLVV